MGENISVSIVISKDRSKFFHCSFLGSTKPTHFVYVNIPYLECSFISCLFFRISTTLAICAHLISQATVASLRNCCLHSLTTKLSYGTGLNYVSVYSTICSNFRVRWSTHNVGGYLKSHFLPQQSLPFDYCEIQFVQRLHKNAKEQRRRLMFLLWGILSWSLFCRHCIFDLRMHNLEDQRFRFLWIFYTPPYQYQGHYQAIYFDVRL